MALREAVLDATAVELAAVGPVGLSISAVAARADVATSVVYNRFSTKERLLDATATERLAPRDASPTLRRPGVPIATMTGAWHQMLLAAAWPGPTRVTIRSAIDGHDASLVPLAADLGSWLLTRGLDRRAPAAARRGPLVDLALGRTPTDRKVGRTTRRVLAHPPRVPTAAPLVPLDALGGALLTATGEAVLADGFAQTTVGGIARRAGTSTGAVYNRFSGKGGLLAEARRHGLPGTAATGDIAMAVRIEALRVAPDDPEVSASVAATEGRALKLRTHGLAVAPARRPGPGPSSIRPLQPGWRRRSRPGPGCWLEQSVPSRPTPPRPSSSRSAPEPPTSAHRRSSVAVDGTTPGGSGGRRGSRTARRLRAGGSGTPRRGLATRAGRRGHRADRGRQPAAQRRHPRTLRQGPRRGRRGATGRSLPGRALRAQGPRAAQRW